MVFKKRKKTFRTLVTIIASIMIACSINWTSFMTVQAKPLDANHQIINNQEGNKQEGSNQDQKPNKPIDSAKVAIVKKENDYSSTYTNVFRKLDGTYEIQMYKDAVNYLENGKWKSIDNTLTDSNNSLENKNNDFKIKLPKTIDDNKKVNIKNKDYSISIQMLNIDKSKGEVLPSSSGSSITDVKNSSSVIYKNINPNVDLQLNVLGEKLKENIIVNQYKENLQFNYIIDSKNLSPVENEDGINFYDNQDHVVFTLDKYMMYDANKNTSNNINVQLTKISEDKYQLTVTPDNNWLANASYPVIIDPTITNNNTNSIDQETIYDTYVSDYAQTTNYNSNPSLVIGNDYNALLEFSLPTLLNNEIITYASLQLTRSIWTTGNQLYIHANTTSYDPTTVTWITKPQYDSNVIDYQLVGSNNQYLFDITKLVQQWNIGEKPNYGLTITSPDTYNAVISLENSDTSSRPLIKIGFADRSGLKDYWTYHSQALGEAGTGYVSDYSGNLSIVRNDYIGSSELMTFNLSFIYNYSQRFTDIGYGSGWSTNYTYDLFTIYTTDDEYGLTGPDGSTIYYTGKSCADLIGNDITDTTCYLAEDGSGNIMLHDKEWNIFTKDNMQFNFDSTRKLTFIKNLKTDQSLTFTYLSDNKLGHVFDDAGNYIEFKYSSSGDIQDLQYANIYLKQPDGTFRRVEMIQYICDEYHNLLSVTRYYDYNSDSSISTNHIEYTYSNNSVTMTDKTSHNTLEYTVYKSRVSKISYYNVTNSVTKLYGKIDISYEFQKTTYKDQDRKSIKYTFDNYGHTINILDDKGNALYYSYYNPYDESTGEYNYDMVNKLKDSSLPQKSQLNPIDNHSFEYTESFTDSRGWYEDIPVSSDGSIGVEYTNDLYGEKSLYINRTNYDGGSPVTLKQHIILDKGNYTISGYIMNSSSDNGGAYIDVDGASSKTPMENFTFKKDEWQQYSLSITVDSDNTLVTIKLENFSVSKAYFDNIQLNEGFVDARYNLLENSSFENSTIGWTLNNSSTVNARNPEHVTGNWVEDDGYYYYKFNSNVPSDHIYHFLSENIALQGLSLPYFSSYVTNAYNIWYFVHDDDGGQSLTWKKLSDKFTNGNVFTGRIYYISDWDDDRSGEFDIQLWAKGSDHDVMFEYLENEKDFDAQMGLRYELNTSKIPSDTSDVLPIIGNSSIKIDGSATTEKTISQTITDSFTSNKTILVGGWAKADAVPNTKDDGREFGIKLDVTYRDEHDDPHTQSYYIPFNSYINDWQYVMGEVVISGKITNMEYTVVYQGTGTAYFDGLQLYVDEFGTRYTYTGNGNVDTINTPTSTNDIKLHYKDKFSNNIDGYWDGNNHYIEVNSNSNGLINSITEKTYNAQNTISTMSYSYNEKNQATSMTVGNVGEQYFTISVGYTSDNQYISSTTDEFNNKTTTNYDHLTGLLQSSTDPEGKSTLFTYNNYGQIVTMKEDTSNILYQYTNNQLTQITENGTAYVMEYNNLGQVDKISIGDDDITSYAYLQDTQGYSTYYTDLLSRQTFNENSYYDFHYDDEYHLTDVLYDGETEYSYEYDQFGRVSVYTDLVNNKTYIYQYDLTGRLREITDEKGNYTSYNYDDKGNFTGTIYHVDGNIQDLQYKYDSDTNFYTGLIYGDENIHENYLYHDYKDNENDALSRLYEIDLFTGNSTIKKNINYDDKSVINGNATSRISSVEYDNVSSNTVSALDKYVYTYDKDGNITDISTYQGSNVDEKLHYVYDSLNQLVREDHYSLNDSYTMVYGYDNYGNILTKTKYSYQPKTSTANLTGGIIVDSFQYSAVGWQDQLTSVGYTSIQYDNSGNPSYIGTVGKYQFNFDGLDTITSATVEMDLHWEGRQLSSIDFYGDKSSTDFDYYYNDQGIRTKKIVNGKTTEYYLDGDEVIYETSGSDTIRYTYDLDGTIISMNLNGTEYFYIIDLQGNITGIVDKDGNQIVSYEYDAYGNILHITDSSGINLGHINPYRYRGYRYDEETGWYYLDSRYYSPQWGRFINADGQINGGILGNNLYAYCENNPVMNIDPTGSNPGVLALGLGFSLGPVGWTIIGVVAVVSVVAVAVYVSENSTPGGFSSPPIDSTPGGYSSPSIDTTSGGFSTTSPGFTHEVFNGEGISTGYMFSEGAENTNPVIGNMESRVPNSEVRAPSTRGNAPISIKDNRSIEIHHEGQNPMGPFKEMHPSDHRYGSNYVTNHPNYNQPSLIDRAQFKSWVKEYWGNEWDNGRW